MIYQIDEFLKGIKRKRAPIREICVKFNIWHFKIYKRCLSFFSVLQIISLHQIQTFLLQPIYLHRGPDWVSVALSVCVRGAPGSSGSDKQNQAPCRRGADSNYSTR